MIWFHSVIVEQNPLQSDSMVCVTVLEVWGDFIVDVRLIRHIRHCNWFNRCHCGPMRMPACFKLGHACRIEVVEKRRSGSCIKCLYVFFRSQYHGSFQWCLALAACLRGMPKGEAKGSAFAAWGGVTTVVRFDSHKVCLLQRLWLEMIRA